jgi:hypothetical protein
MTKRLHQHKCYCQLSEIISKIHDTNTVVCDQEIPALSVKAASIMPIMTGVKQAKRRREMVPVLLKRIHNKLSGNYSPTQQVSVDPPSKTSYGLRIQYIVSVT